MVGKHGLRQLCWTKGIQLLLLIGLLAAATPQVVQPALQLSDGDKPKIGTGI